MEWLLVIAQLLASIVGVLGFINSRKLTIAEREKAEINLCVEIRDANVRFDCPEVERIEMLLDIQNNSSSPICIHGFRLIQGNDLLFSELISLDIVGTQGRIFRSFAFPMNLAPHQGCLAFVVFVRHEGDRVPLAKHVEIRALTSTTEVQLSGLKVVYAHYICNK